MSSLTGIEHRPPRTPAHHLAAEARTVGEMLRLRAARSGLRPALYTREPHSGRWIATTWDGYLDRASRIARGLINLGLHTGDRVAIVGPTQPQWTFCDFGALLAGLTSLGVYPQQTAEQVRYILTHSDARVVFAGDLKELATLVEAARDLPGVLAIVPWDEALYAQARAQGLCEDRRVLSPEHFRGEPLTRRELDELQAQVDPDDTAILVYTSGTTGPPKGAMITHRNIVSMLARGNSLQEMYEEDVVFSFLPMAHVAERILSCYGRVSSGVQAAYATSMAQILTELREVRPTVFGSVPRIFEKAHSKILSELEKKPPAVQRLFRWADDVARRRIRLVLAGQPVPRGLAVQFAIADRIVFKQIRDVFGGLVRYFIVGAAPTPPDVLEFFWAIGLPIFEVYGQTEATAITHVNHPGERGGPPGVRLGTVGQLIPGLEQRIAEDGEVLVRGPWVFKGYFKNPDATAEVLKDGWLHTGDIGVLDGGFLRITDRKKHLIITAGGKNLTPANIESALKTEDPLISQVVAHGDRRPYVSALIAPSPLETLDWGASRGLISEADHAARTRELFDNPSARSEALNSAMAGVVRHPEFSRRIVEAVRRGNRRLAHVERVRRVHLLDRDLSQEHGEMTPTMKVKRKEVESRYRAELDRLYTEPSFGLEVEPEHGA